MNAGFIRRVLKTSGILGLLCLAFGTYYYGFQSSISIFTGIIWGMINLYFLERLVRSTLKPDGIDKKTALILLFIKFPMLYASVYFVVTSDYFNPILFLIGFTVVLAVIVLKSVGRVLLKLDNEILNDKIRDKQESLKSV